MIQTEGYTIRREGFASVRWACKRLIRSRFSLRPDFVEYIAAFHAARRRG